MDLNLEFFKRKELGLPIWVWAAIVSVVLFLLYLHFKRTGANINPVSAAATDPGSGSLALPDAGGGISQPTPLDNTNPLSDAFNTLTDGISAVLGGQQSLLDLFSNDPRLSTPVKTQDATPTNISGGSASASDSVGTTAPLVTQTKVSDNLPIIDATLKARPGITPQMAIAEINQVQADASHIPTAVSSSKTEKTLPIPNTNPTGTTDVSPPSIATPAAQAKAQRGAYQPL